MAAKTLTQALLLAYCHGLTKIRSKFMAQKKLFFVQFLIEADVSEWPDFDELEAASYFKSILKLSDEDKVHRVQAYLLARKPDERGDLLVERYEDRGLDVHIYQDADTVGTDVPTYYVTVYNPTVKSPSSSVGDSHPTIEAAKEEARTRVGKRLERQSNQRKR
jgi:hypothetical protein